MVNLLKSIFHNVGVAIVGLGIAFVGTKVVWLLGIPSIASSRAWAVDASGARISPSCVGNGPFLCAQHAGDFTRTSRNTDHVRPVSFFAESALSRRKRVANSAFRYRDSHSLGRSLHPLRRRP